MGGRIGFILRGFWEDPFARERELFEVVVACWSDLERVDSHAGPIHSFASEVILDTEESFFFICVPLDWSESQRPEVDSFSFHVMDYLLTSLPSF